MIDGHRYVVTLTSSAHMALPLPRVMWRSDDQAATEAAERELRRHRNTRGATAVFDGWRLRKSVPGKANGELVAEVRPDYDSRKVAAQRSSQSGAPPF